jgi:Rrf2 family transcriptional regulator, cysteine metabolism repressor
MQLSQSVTYALQSLLQLAESGEGVLITRGKLAANGQMPERFLLEILHDLVKRGILRSTRGGGGGFALARPPEEISLLDVIEAIDGPLPVGIPSGNSMPDSLCRWLRLHLEEITEGVRVRLAGITLKQLLLAASRRTVEHCDRVPVALPAASVAAVPYAWPLAAEQETEM